jgi:lysozyme family protein
MASVDEAIQYALRFEDATLSGKVTVDAGGRTRFGIAEKFHPELSASLYYTTMGSEAALKIAEGIYERDYCEPLCIALLKNQVVANKLLSLGINIGIYPAAKMLQDALRVSGDGRIGPLTLAAEDDCDPLAVLDSMREQAAMHYEYIVKYNPADRIYLNGWLRRAEA